MPLTYIRREDLELQFEWNGAHTVNVQPLDDPSKDLDCYSIGDYSKNEATYEEFVESVEEYAEERDE